MIALPEITKAWLAGFFDGEGQSWGFSSKNRGDVIGGGQGSRRNIDKFLRLVGRLPE